MSTPNAFPPRPPARLVPAGTTAATPPMGSAPPQVAPPLRASSPSPAAALSSFAEAARAIERENRELRDQLAGATEALRQRDAQLAQTLQTMQGELAQAEKEVQHYQAAWSKYSERDQILQRLLGGQDELQGVREEVRAALASLADASARERELITLREQLSSRQQRASELETLAASLRADQESQKALHDRALSAYKSAVEGQSSLDRQKALHDLGARKEKIVRELEQDVQRLRNQIANRDARLHELEALLKTAKEEIRSSQDLLRTQAAEVRRELEARHERELRETREHASDEAKAARKSFDAALASLTATQAEQLTRFRAEQSRLDTREKEARDAEHSKLRSRYEQSERELRRLNEDLATATDAAAAKDYRIQALLQQIACMREALLADKELFRSIAQEADRLGSAQVADRLEHAARVQVLQ